MKLTETALGVEVSRLTIKQKVANKPCRAREGFATCENRDNKDSLVDCTATETVSERERSYQVTQTCPKRVSVGFRKLRNF